MKNLISLFIVVTLLAVSCVREDDSFFANSSEKAASVTAPGNVAFIKDVSTGAELPIGLLGKSKASEIKSVKLMAVFYVDGEEEDPEAEGTEVADITTVPSTATLTEQQLLDLAGVASTNDLNPGDRWVVKYKITLDDGRELTKAGTTNIAFTCASNIPLGSYTASSDAESTDGCPSPNPLDDFTFSVTLSADGDGQYEVSDFFAGVYMEFYGACYGYTFETPATFTDVCNNLSFSFQDAFGATVQGTGTYDPGTGIITYTWTNDFGDTGTVTLTKD